MDKYIRHPIREREREECRRRRRRRRCVSYSRASSVDTERQGHDLDLALFKALTSKDEGRFNPLFTRTSQTGKRIFAHSDLTVRTREKSDGLNKDLRDPIEKVSEQHRLIFTEKSSGLAVVPLNISTREQLPKTNSTLVLNRLRIVEPDRRGHCSLVSLQRDRIDAVGILGRAD